MRKLLLYLIACLLLSCEVDDAPNKITSEENLFEVVKDSEGNSILSFENTGAFLEEYEKLSELITQKEFNSWSSGINHSSLLKKSDSILAIADSIGVLYSDALMSLLNSEGEVKINGETLKLEGDIFYMMPVEEVNNSSTERKKRAVGYLRNSISPNLISMARTIDNANKWKSYSKVFGERRLIVELFNETIYFNDNTLSSKMFLRSRKDYESCSFWRCTWKNDVNTPRRLMVNVTLGGVGRWFAPDGSHQRDVIEDGILGHYTLLLATYNPVPPVNPEPNNFEISGYVTTSLDVGTTNELNWGIQVSWFPPEN